MFRICCFRRLVESIKLAISVSLLLLLVPSTLVASSIFDWAPTPGEVEDAHVRVLQADEGHVILESGLSLWQIEYVHNAVEACVTLKIAGLDQDGAVGMPQLPVQSTQIGVPPDAEIVVRVLEQESVPVELTEPVCSAPQSVLEDRPNAALRYAGKEYVADSRKYTTDTFYPQTIAKYTDLGFLRNQRIGRVSFHPVQYNPVSGQLRVFTRLVVDVRFGDGQVESKLSADGNVLLDAPPYETLFRNTLLNYAQAKSWRKAKEPADQSEALPIYLTEPSYKIFTEQPGIYRLTYSDLQAAGLDIDALDPRTIRMFHRDNEIVVHVAGEDDGSFDHQDYIEFYAEANKSIYSDTNVYWLTSGGEPGARMGAKNGQPSETTPVASSYTTTLHFEEDHLYWPAPTAMSGRDYWYWLRVYATSQPVSTTLGMELPHLSPENGAATLRIAVKSRGGQLTVDPDHHLQVYLNRGLREDAKWDGEQVRIIENQIPLTELNHATNELRLAIPVDLPVEFDVIYLDWYEVDYPRSYVTDADSIFFSYPGVDGLWQYKLGGFSQDNVRVYDVSNPLTPKLITDAAVHFADPSYQVVFDDISDSASRYLALSEAQVRKPKAILKDVPSRLHDRTNVADYILITHSDFYTATLRLAEYRHAQGMRTVLVDIEDIYDEFNYGIFAPESVHDFLAYAYANWQPPAPSFVLLMGDGNLDFRDNLGSGEANYIPPLMAQVDPWLGETISDNRYVTINGNDPLPDMFIGRLPVSTLDQANNVVDKIIAFEEGIGGEWRKQVLFVADNQDAAGDFANLADNLVDRLPSEYNAQRIYYKVTHDDPSKVTSAIVQSINHGVSFVNYVGHAGVQRWASEKLFSVSDIGALNNVGMLPIMLPWTCYEGLFAYPGVPSLSEELVRMAGAGAIASWAPTGLGVASGHDILAANLYNAIFNDRVARLGPAIAQAKIQFFAETPSFHELLDTYLLLGDPALSITMTNNFSIIYLPWLSRTQ